MYPTRKLDSPALCQGKGKGGAYERAIGAPLSCCEEEPLYRVLVPVAGITWDSFDLCEHCFRAVEPGDDSLPFWALGNGDRRWSTLDTVPTRRERP